MCKSLSSAYFLYQVSSLHNFYQNLHKALLNLSRVSEPGALKTLILLNIQKQLLFMYIDNKQNTIHSAAFSVDVGYQIVSKSIQRFRRRRSSANKWKNAIIPSGVLCTTYKEIYTDSHIGPSVRKFGTLCLPTLGNNKHEILRWVRQQRHFKKCGNLSNHINHMNSMIFVRGTTVRIILNTSKIWSMVKMATKVTTVRIILNTSTIWTMVKMATTVTTVRIILNTSNIWSMATTVTNARWSLTSVW